MANIVTCMTCAGSGTLLCYCTCTWCKGQRLSEINCPSCRGSKRGFWGGVCKACAGSGKKQVECYKCKGKGGNPACPSCHGQFASQCHRCDGVGRAPLMKYVTLLEIVTNSFMVGDTRSEYDDSRAKNEALPVCSPSEVDSFIAKRVPDSPWRPGRLVSFDKGAIKLEFDDKSTSHDISIYRVGADQYVMHSWSGGVAYGYSAKG